MVDFTTGSSVQTRIIYVFVIPGFWEFHVHTITKLFIFDQFDCKHEQSVFSTVLIQYPKWTRSVDCRRIRTDGRNRTSLLSVKDIKSRTFFNVRRNSRVDINFLLYYGTRSFYLYKQNFNFRKILIY